VQSAVNTSWLVDTGPSANGQDAAPAGQAAGSAVASAVFANAPAGESAFTWAE
jgi:hypothetical protein